MGVFLRKNVIETAGAAMRANLTRLAPRVLPLAELAKCAADAHYVPNFKTGFDSVSFQLGINVTYLFASLVDFSICR